MTLRVGLAQIKPVLGDLQGNLALHYEIIEEAERRGLDMVVFPELSLTGYFVKDMVLDLALDVASTEIEGLARRSGKIGIVAGFVEDGPGHRIYNSAAAFQGGEVRHVHRKVYLPTYGMFDEARYFVPGSRVAPFESPVGRAGLLVCEDLWHVSNPWLLWLHDVDVLLGVSSSPARGLDGGESFETTALWRQIVEFHSRFFGQYTLYVNRVGVEDGVTFGGGTQAVDPFGRRLFEADLDEEGLFEVEIDPEEIRRARLVSPLRRDERPEMVMRELARILDAAP